MQKVSIFFFVFLFKILIFLGRVKNKTLFTESFFFIFINETIKLIKIIFLQNDKITNKLKKKRKLIL